MSKLKPCPFCGGRALTYTIMKKYNDITSPVEVWKVMCAERVNCCTLLNDFTSEQEAIDAWNRRANDV